MLKPGTPTNFSADSMAYAIEQAMIAFEVFDPADDTDEAVEQRRKALAAIATGIVNHLKAALEISVAQNKIAAGLPAAAVQLRGQDGAVQ
jgi:hypothetical protein